VTPTQAHVLEIVLHWAAAGIYGVSALLVTFAVVFERRTVVRWALAAATIGLVPHAAAIVAHWVEVGHGPYHTRYEIFTSTSWTAMAVLVAVLWRRPAWAALAIVGFPIALLGQGLGLFSGPTAPQMPPALRSVWLVYHILFAKLAAAAFLVSASSGLVTLLRSRPRRGAWLDRTPPVPVLDALSIRAAGFGLVFWTVTMAAGAIWGNDTWGRYWGWDPVETWALVSWLVYGSFLHARLFLRLRPVPTAWLAVGCFVFFVVAFLVIPIFARSIHNATFA
jgi:cytochrome c-type biogenesis protein CcsB